MKIIIYWKWEETENLTNKVQKILDNIWLLDLINVEKSTDESLKLELSITKEPALIIEEEAIEFKDTIFEGINPPESEIEAMITSIIWTWWDISCAPSSCWSCSSADVCGTH